MTETGKILKSAIVDLLLTFLTAKGTKEGKRKCGKAEMSVYLEVRSPPAVGQA